MQLRPYRPSDLQTLHEIDHACFPPGVSYSREELAHFVARRGSRTWVAEEGEAIIGFLIANRDSKEVGHIVTIDVVEPWRRRGVGSALMETCEAWAESEGVGFLYLETAEDNSAARAFYAGRGYAKLEKIPGYYEDGTAAWVMVKKLRQKPADGKMRESRRGS